MWLVRAFDFYCLSVLCSDLGAFPFHQTHFWHNVWSAVYFLSALLWMAIHTWISFTFVDLSKSEYSDDPHYPQLRACLTFLSSACFVGMALLWKFGAVPLLSSFLEILMAISWELFFLTLYPSFSRVKISIQMSSLVKIK